MSADPVRRARPAALAFALLLVGHLGPGCAAKGDGQVDGDVTVESQIRGEWKLFSFAAGDVLRDDDGEPLVVEDPSQTDGWDLAVSQWVVATNSGASASPGSVSRGALLAVEGDPDEWPDLASFDAACSDFDVAGATANTGAFGCNAGTPTVDDGWIADSEDDPDGAGPFGTVSFHPSVTFWFEYSFSGHEVFPYGNVYVVEAADGSCVKLQLTDYYDASGESGFVSFSWDALPP